MLQCVSLLWVITSVYWGFSATSFMSLWVGLELNMLGFVTYMVLSMPRSPKLPIMYFVVQAVGSTGVLLTLVLSNTDPDHTAKFELLASIFLFLKIGLAPLHSWLVFILSRSNWDVFFMATTFQKIIPLTLVLFIRLEFYFLYAFINMMICLVSLNMSGSLMFTLAYISVASSSWVVVSSNLTVALGYLLFYGVGLSAVWFTIGQKSVSSISPKMLFDSNLMVSLLAFCVLLSLGGVPPLAGFWLKVLIIIQVLQGSGVLVVVFLVLSSVLILLAYIRMMVHLLSGQELAEYSLMDASVGSQALVFMAVSFLPLFIMMLSVGVMAQKVLIF